MKYASTKKNIVAAYGAENIICVPYADLQNLLRMEDAEAYTSGIYGWNADIYGFGGFAICTGYRPFGRVHPSRDLVTEFDHRARRVLESVPCPNDWEETRRILHDLATEFVLRAVGEC